MKKLFFYAVAAAGLLSACSSNDDVIATGVDNPDGPQAIKIGVSSVSTQVGTRGTGTVGGVSQGETVLTPNNWAGQKINVYMFEKGTLTLATDGTNELYNNAIMNAPKTGSTGEASLTDGAYKYYPAAGTFDFWGYRLDGAESTNVTEGENAYTIDFKIDGSQDVMRAKAEKLLTEEELTNKTYGSVTNDDIYSAKAARQTIQPELVFKHLLTRFTFQIKGGNEGSCPKEVEEGGTTTLDETTAVKINKIELTSKTNGTLTVAHTGEAPDSYIIWSEDEATTDTDNPTNPKDGVIVGDKFQPYLTLKARTAKVKVEAEEALDESSNLKDGYTSAEEDGTTNYYKLDEAAELEEFTGATPNVWKNGTTEPKNIGEALLVSPGHETYKLRVTLSQKVLKHALAEGVEATEDDYEVKNNVYTLDVNATDVMLNDSEAGLTTFAAGNSYNVIITVYGFERIIVNTTLTPWEDGGNVEVGGDDD